MGHEATWGQRVLKRRSRPSQRKRSRERNKKGGRGGKKKRGRKKGKWERERWQCKT